LYFNYQIKFELFIFDADFNSRKMNIGDVVQVLDDNLEGKVVGGGITYNLRREQILYCIKNIHLKKACHSRQAFFYFLN
jgi:hypothetical protein